MKRFLISICVLVIALTATAAIGQSRYTVQDLMKVRRVGDPRLSPDGKHIAFTIGDVNFDANRIVNQIYVMPVNGGDMKQLTNGNSSATSPRWSSDGKKIAYVTGGQIWKMDADGSDKTQITKISTDAAGPVWSPDGRWLAFTSDVYPDCADDDCNKRKEEAAEKSKVKAHVTDRLLYRHWLEWRNTKRTHVFVVSASGGSARDLTPGDFDSPPYAASGDTDYSFSPDGQEIAFLRNPDKVEAISTNSDIFTVPITGGTPKNITTANRGYDIGPIYTRDGKYIVYRSQATASFEADRWRLMRYDRVTGRSTELLRAFDLNVEEVAVSPDSNTVFFAAGERGQQPIYAVAIAGGTPRKVATRVYSSNLQVAPDGNSILFLNSSLAMPSEVFRVNVDGSGLAEVTNVNRDLMRAANLRDAEDVDWIGAAGAKVHGYVIKPANFDATKSYPLLVLVHGGPQSAWNNSWGFRWNPQIFAGAGYVVLMPNPRGSTGYGQQFINEISADWGGKAFIDVKNGIAEVLRRNTFIDKNRIGAAGGSYGGYFIDWVLGHNNDPRFRFKALVSHAGVYNLTSMYGATEELWFPEWEFKGTPWSNPAMYQRWSPHMFAQNFNTPTLVTAGELDYRVPYTQSLELFTALQRRGVDSKLILYPDEGHWILKPQNSEFWYQNVIQWFDKYLK